MGQITEERSAPLMASVSGVRGIVGASLTPEVLCRFAGALASWLREQPEARPVIVVGRDGREGGEVAAQIAVGALRAAGMRVVDLGVAMTATVGVMVKRHRAAGGLVLTASHNSAEWNGLKPITRLGSAPAPDQASAILQRFHNARAEWASYATLGELDCDDAAAHAHVAAVLERIEPIVSVAEIASRRFRVALDSVNASGSLAGPMLLEALGCRVERVACDGSGVFPHAPEPTAANLVSLGEATRSTDVDVAFAQDPDADRLAIVDETAAYLGEEYTLALAAQAILPDREAAVLAANLSTSRMIDDVAARFGARVVRTPVGEANVVAGMREHQAALGGEGNGGVIWPDVVEIRDSLGAMALVLALMTREGRPLSAIAADLPSYAIVKRKAPIREGLAEHAYGMLKERFAGATFDEQDGLRLDLDNPPSWIHVRPSNTEPIFRVIAEAPSRAEAEKLASEAEDIVASL